MKCRINDLRNVMTVTIPGEYVVGAIILWFVWMMWSMFGPLPSPRWLAIECVAFMMPVVGVMLLLDTWAKWVVLLVFTVFTFCMGCLAARSTTKRSDSDGNRHAKEGSETGIPPQGV